jgi:hypothetical protein
MTSNKLFQVRHCGMLKLSPSVSVSLQLSGIEGEVDNTASAPLGSAELGLHYAGLQRDWT